MRAILTAFLLTAGAAAAEDCKLPTSENEQLRGVIDFSKCIQKRVNGLEAENTKLHKEIKDMKAALDNIPGEFVSENGRETRTGGNRLRQASYALSSRSRESASSVALDPKVLDELCRSGCTVTLLQSAEKQASSQSAESDALGPCAFRYDSKTGRWSLTGCGDAVSGIDGNGTPTGEPGGEIVAAVGGACILADAGTSVSVTDASGAPEQSLGRDRAKGLYLIAEPRLWSGAESRFRCEVKIAR